MDDPGRVRRTSRADPRRPVPIPRPILAEILVIRAESLPVIESCDGCGACCLVVTHPPFYSVFHDQGEEAWERLKRERRDLILEIVADYKARRAAGEPLSGTPCLWYDPATRRCRHYDHRPLACREFLVGEDDCRDARRRAGIDEG